MVEAEDVGIITGALFGTFLVAAYFATQKFRGPQKIAMKEPPIVFDLVFIGGGHSHALALKMLGMPPYRQKIRQYGIQITLIAKDIHTPYSGMLPGYVSGHYSFDEIHIDLQKLCRFANVRLIHAAASKITYNQGGGGLVYFEGGRPPVRYDCISIDIGSAPAKGDQIYHDSGVIPVKPISNFCSYYEDFLQKFLALKEIPQTYTVGIVGGGASGVELILSIQHRLMTLRPNAANCLQMVLITRGEIFMETHNPIVQAIFRRILQERNIKVYLGAEVTAVKELEDHRKELSFNDPSRMSVILNECVWCITAGVSTWLQKNTPFATTLDGFIRVNETYESISHAGVFAAGDCCHMDLHPRPKGRFILCHKEKMGHRK